MKFGNSLAIYSGLEEGDTNEVRCIMEEVISRLREFIENEARSCSMDPGCITPEYVFRMWGGTVALEDIETGLKEIKNGCR